MKQVLDAKTTPNRRLPPPTFVVNLEPLFNLYRQRDAFSAQLHDMGRTEQINSFMGSAQSPIVIDDEDDETPLAARSHLNTHANTSTATATVLVRQTVGTAQTHTAGINAGLGTTVEERDSKGPNLLLGMGYEPGSGLGRRHDGRCCLLQELVSRSH